MISGFWIKYSLTILSIACFCSGVNGFDSAPAETAAGPGVGATCSDAPALIWAMAGSIGRSWLPIVISAPAVINAAARAEPFLAFSGRSATASKDEDMCEAPMNGAAGRDCHGLRFVRRLVIDDVVHLDPRGRTLPECTLGALSKDLRLFYVTLNEIRLRDCRVCIGLFALTVVGVS